MNAGMDAMQAGHLVRETKKLRQACDVIAAMLSVVARNIDPEGTLDELDAMFKTWDREDGVT